MLSGISAHFSEISAAHWPASSGAQAACGYSRTAAISPAKPINTPLKIDLTDHLSLDAWSQTAAIFATPGSLNAA